MSNDVLENGYSWTKVQSSNNLSNLYFDLDMYNECIDTCKYNLHFFENDSRMAANQLFYSNALYLTAHCIYLTAPSSRAAFAYGIDCISKAISLKPNNVDYLFVAGMLYKLNGDLDNAKQNFTKASNLGDSQSRIQLGKLQMN